MVDCWLVIFARVEWVDCLRLTWLVWPEWETDWLTGVTWTYPPYTVSSCSVRVTTRHTPKQTDNPTQSSIHCDGIVPQITKYTKPHHIPSNLNIFIPTYIRICNAPTYIYIPAETPSLHFLSFHSFYFYLYNPSVSQGPSFQYPFHQTIYTSMIPLEAIYIRPTRPSSHLHPSANS